MLLASRAEDRGLHRTIVRIGAAAAWVITAIYAAIAAVTVDASLWLQAVSPLAASVLMTAQIAFDKEDAGVALFGSGLMSVVWFTLFGTHVTLVAAAISTILIATLWMFFVKTHRAMVATGLAVALFVIPLFWPVGDYEVLSFATIMSASFVLLHLVLSTLQKAASEVDSRYQILFDTSPSAVLEEDWSGAIDYIHSEYTGKPNRLRQFLLAYPTVVRNAIARAKILRANDAAIELLEIDDPEGFIGFRSPNVVTEDTIEPFVDALVRLYEGTPTWDADIPMTTRDGSIRWLQARSMRNSSDSSQIVIAITDVTHMKKRHDAMADLVRAKDEFIATVSHELRTPLTAVIGLTTEMAGTEIPADEQKELMGLVADQAQEMYNIVDDLLVAARAEMGTVTVETTDVDLFAELTAAVEGVGIDIDCPSEDDCPRVKADPSRVRQILRNLLTNAQRYGGPECRIVAGSSGDLAWLEVRDNGPGIPPEHADRIFEPYVTGNIGASGSVGLGLAVARQLAELMGGSLTYEHDSSESVFRLRLPLVETRRPALASQAESG